MLTACSGTYEWKDLNDNPRGFFNLDAPVRVADEAVAGSKVLLKTGQALIVRLPEDAATGYTWRMRPLPSGSVIAPVHHDYTAKPGADPAAVGGGGEATFRIRGVAPGQQAVTIDYLRAGFDTPEKSIAFDVTVR